MPLTCYNGDNNKEKGKTMGIVISILIFLALVWLAFWIFGRGVDNMKEATGNLKDARLDMFANKFYSKNGVTAPATLYVSEFEKKFGRKPNKAAEIKVPANRASDISDYYQAAGLV